MPGIQEQFVATAVEVRDCVAHLAEVKEIALDTEFVGEDRYRPDLCLVQLATREKLFVVDPLSCGPLDDFWNELIRPAHTLIVHAGREEMRICNFAVGSTPSNLFDLQVLAALVGIGYPVGYGSLIQHLLGKKLPKGETLTDWRKRPLRDEQIVYAFDDVRYLLPMWDRIHEQLTRLDRLEWAREECDLFVTKSLVESQQTEKWRKLPGLNSLDRRKLAIVREIFRWREERALQVNRPARFLLRDDLIVEVARRNPSTEKDFSSLRGLGKPDFNGILQAVERARSMPQSEWPEAFDREVDSPQVTMMANLLSIILADLCIEQQLTSAFVATISDVRALVRAEMAGEKLDEGNSLNRSWRKEIILPVLGGFLRGKKSIRIRDLHSEAPFEIRDAE